MGLRLNNWNKYSNSDTENVKKVQEPNHLVKKAMFIFILLTILLTSGFAILFHMLEMNMLSPFLMIIPLLTSFFIQKNVLKRPLLGSNGLGFHLGKKRYLFLGPLFSFLFIVVVYGMSYLWNPDLFTIDQTHLSIRDMTTFNESHSLWKNILIAGSIQFLFAPFLNILIFVGEEVGWRAFLYPNMLALYGRKGLIFGGLVWGIWHTPMIYLYDLNFGEYHHLGLVFMIIFCVFMGIIMQFVYCKSGSIFSVALMHGMLNITGTFIRVFSVTREYRYFIDGATGMIGLSILCIIAVLCYTRFSVKSVSANL